MGLTVDLCVSAISASLDQLNHFKHFSRLHIISALVYQKYEIHSEGMHIDLYNLKFVYSPFLPQ
jgi:hypothetical protein